MKSACRCRKIAFKVDLGPRCRSSGLGLIMSSEWKMLQCEGHSDFVIAADIAFSLKEFAETAFAEVGLGWRDHVEYDPALACPSDILRLLGDGTCPTARVASLGQVCRDRDVDA